MPDSNYTAAFVDEDGIFHYGVKGMKWRHRRKAAINENKAFPRNKKVSRTDSPAEVDAAVKNFRTTFNLTTPSDEERKANGTYWNISEFRKTTLFDDYSDKQIRDIIDITYYTDQMEKIYDDLDKANKEIGKAMDQYAKSARHSGTSNRSYEEIGKQFIDKILNE